jgi:hypothetical protein
LKQLRAKINEDLGFFFFIPPGFQEGEVGGKDSEKAQRQIRPTRLLAWLSTKNLLPKDI